MTIRLADKLTRFLTRLCSLCAVSPHGWPQRARPPADERREIENWLITNSTSPTTGEELEDKKLRPTYTVRSQIKAFLQNHRNISTGM